MEGAKREIRDGMLVLSRTSADGVEVIGVAGELDLANTTTLDRQLSEAEEGGSAITLDLSELEFIDSTGIALLVAAHRRLNHGSEDRLKLVRSRADAVRDVLELTGVDSELPFVAVDGAAPDGAASG